MVIFNSYVKLPEGKSAILGHDSRSSTLQGIRKDTRAK